jgi:hypothetical protein
MFGFGKGKMELALSNTNASYGEMITGTATLQLKEPQLARGFIIEIVVQKERPSSDEDSMNDVDIIYRVSQPLMGEGQYSSEPYAINFQIQIPQQSQIPDAHVGSLGKMFGGVKVQWYIIAKLDIAKGRDVSKKIKIKVS